ncbi:hypothetical protein EBB07_19505 [Paenibacillaceae bacterium]|nr:hypothetical protein EBB07_19505 [Paenibacillaceae bacterium]
MSAIDWVVSLQQLVEMIHEIAMKTGKKISALMRNQLEQWMAALPSYIKAYLPISLLRKLSSKHNSYSFCFF